MKRISPCLDVSYNSEGKSDEELTREFHEENPKAKTRQEIDAWEKARPEYYADQKWWPRFWDWERLLWYEWRDFHHYPNHVRILSSMIREQDQPKLKAAIKAMHYSEFLESAYWQMISSAIRRSARKCQQCGSENNLQVHHKTYAHHGEEHKYMGDMECLCERCHKGKHAVGGAP